MTETLNAAELLTEAERLANADPDEALRTLDLIADTKPDTTPSIRAGALYLRARLTAIAGEPTGALHLIEQARTIWRDDGDDLSAIRAGLGEMNVLDDLGRHDRALVVGNSMLTSIAAFNPSSEDESETCRWLRARTLHNIGTARGLKGDHAGALSSYREAAATWNSLGLDREEATARTNIGVELTAIGRADEALVELDGATATFSRLGDRLTVATVDGLRGDALVRLGRFADSLDVFERSRLELENVGAEVESARLSLRTAATYLRLDLADEAGHVARETIERCLAAGLEHDRASAELICGDAALRLGELDTAATHLDAAVSCFEHVGDGLGQVEALLVRSRLASSTGRQDDARNDAGIARRLADTADWPPAAITARLALVDLDPGTAEADDLLAEAESRATELPIPDLHYEIDWRRGRQDRLAGRLDDARRTLDETVMRVEELRNRLVDDDLRRSFSFGRSAAQYEQLRLGLLGDTGEQIAALKRADRAKARILAERLQRGGAAGEFQVPPADDQAEQQLRATYNELLGAGTQPRVHRRHLLERVADLEHANQVARLRRSAVGESSHADRDVVLDTQPAREEPAPDTSTPTIAYQQIDDEIVALVQTPDGDSVHRRLAGVETIERLVADLETQWQRQQAPADFVARHAQRLLQATNGILGRLHELLVLPFEKLLESCPGDRLAIAPDGVIHRVPFAALGTDGRCLADRWALTTVPSLDVAARLQPISTTVPTSVLAMGVSDADTPNVDDEVVAVAEAYPQAESRHGNQSTFAALRVGARAADVVHLACHGLFRADNPMYSSIQLGDGWITAHDLTEVPFDGALVVLSACESGRQAGKGRGDESTGLSWAALAAGAGGVVVSKWLVDDAATSTMMRDFHHRVASGTEPDCALRDAQIASRRDHPHPYLWAPFTFVGGLPRTRPTSDRK